MAMSASRAVPSAEPVKRGVLVLGHDTRAFLSLVRSLGRAEIEVHVGWFEDGEPALSSRYVAEAHQIPAYRPDEPKWKDVLAELMQAQRFDLVIPCDDQRALPLAAHREELERWGRLALPSPEALAVLGGKFKPWSSRRRIACSSSAREHRPWPVRCGACEPSAGRRAGVLVGRPDGTRPTADAVATAAAWDIDLTRIVPASCRMSSCDRAMQSGLLGSVGQVAASPSASTAAQHCAAHRRKPSSLLLEGHDVGRSLSRLASR
jgi:hypothetical protein